MLAVLVDRVLQGVIVRAARLLVFVLAVEDVLVWTGAVREATSTVRFTGRDRVTLLPNERLETVDLTG